MSLSGFVDKRRGAAFNAAGVATIANYASVAAVNARLTAINGTYWSASRLATTGINDKVYAMRLADDAAGV